MGIKHLSPKGQRTKEEVINYVQAYIKVYTGREAWLLSAVLRDGFDVRDNLIEIDTVRLKLDRLSDVLYDIVEGVDPNAIDFESIGL